MMRLGPGLSLRPPSSLAPPLRSEPVHVIVASETEKDKQATFHVAPCSGAAGAPAGSVVVIAGIVACVKLDHPGVAEVDATRMTRVGHNRSSAGLDP